MRGILCSLLLIVAAIAVGVVGMLGWAGSALCDSGSCPS